MKMSELENNMKVKTRITLCGVEVGTQGSIKFDNGKPPYGASGEAVMVNFAQGSGLYFRPEDIEAA